MNNKKGFIEAWLLLVAILAGILIAIFYPEPQLTEQVITSKTVEETGTSCFKILGFIDCSKKYTYYINGYDVGERTFNSVQEGETYLCTRHFEYCKELENE